MPSPRRTATSDGQGDRLGERRGRGSPADRDGGGDVEAVDDELEGAGGQVVAQPHAAGVRRDDAGRASAPARSSVTASSSRRTAPAGSSPSALARLDAAAGDAGIGRDGFCHAGEGVDGESRRRPRARACGGTPRRSPATARCGRRGRGGPTHPGRDPPGEWAARRPGRRTSRLPRGRWPPRAQAASPRSLRSFATWPVALTLYWASSILPFSSTTNVERITPSTSLPYSFLSP